MASVCGVSFGACLLRVTRLDDNGNVIAGSNAYVSDKLVSVAVNPNIEAGNTFTVRNGCGCTIARKKFPDTFNWWDLVITSASLEPQLQAFLLGAETIDNAGTVTGVAFPSALDCSDQAPQVAIEFWAENTVGSGLDPTYPYWHWVIPSTVWQLGDNTFEEGPAQPVLNGFSQTNSNWGEGPYGDGPPDGADISEGGYWATDDPLPTAMCATQSVTSTS